MFPEVLETQRLRLEKFCRENVSPYELHRVLGPDTSEIFRYVSSSPYATAKEAYDDLRESERMWDEREKARYVIRPRQTEDGAGEVAGVTSLKCMWGKRTGRLGIKLRKPFWGRGYSEERADALIQLAFEELDLEIVSAGYQEDNQKSKRAIEKYIEKYGGSYDGVLRNWVPVDGEVHDLHRYTVSREEYFEAVDEESS